jgi:CBS domain-containing protein
MRIVDILRSKGSSVATVTETTTVTALLAELAEHNIGAAVVIGPEGLVGVVSERDVVRRLHEQGPDLLHRPVGQIMSSTVVTCRPADPVEVLAELMTHNRVRHIPVLDDGRLVGIVSLGDVVKNHIEELAAERRQLQAYITQGG